MGLFYRITLRVVNKKTVKKFKRVFNLNVLRKKTEKSRKFFKKILDSVFAEAYNFFVKNPTPYYAVGFDFLGA